VFHVKHMRPQGLPREADVPDERAEIQEIVDGAGAMGVDLSEAAATVIALHLQMVYEANKVVNLTRIDRDSAVSLHVLDSLSGLGEMGDSPVGPWLDIGSGAGFPGVPLAVASGRHVDLLESVGRKSTFLQSVVGGLRLDATVRGCRAEDAAAESPGAYSAVSARAVSELPALVELASPLLAPGGRLVCWKGDPTRRELERGSIVAARTGMRHVRSREIHLMGSDTRRVLVVYERTEASAVRLPRRVGLAQSKPLA
jgi:16S rRNA (guanine527-N7)-methyltransferase